MNSHPKLESAPRLLLLSSEFPPGPGGIGTHAFQLARQLSPRGWQLTVVAPQDYVTLAERDAFNREQPFAVVPLPGANGGAGKVGQRLAAVWRAWRRTQPQVVMASGSRALWLGAALHTAMRLPWLAVVHGTELHFPSPPARRLTAWAVRQATTVVAVSRYTAELTRRTGVCPRRICVIPNGADAGQFQPGRDVSALRRELGLDGRRVVLTLGRVCERKAQDMVIRALPEITARYPDVIYLMVGLPEQEEAFRDLAVALGVAQHVRFCGKVAQEQLVDYYNLCDLFVLVSRQAAGGDVEGYGIVVLEAALCGKPAVVSDSGGLPETVEDGLSGLIVPADDPGATARAILSLLESDERRQQMGCIALERAHDATWQRRALDYDRRLQELLNHV